MTYYILHCNPPKIKTTLHGLGTYFKSGMFSTDFNNIQIAEVDLLH